MLVEKEFNCIYITEAKRRQNEQQNKTKISLKIAETVKPRMAEAEL